MPWKSCAHGKSSAHMSKQVKTPSGTVLLGIECGATRTTAEACLCGGESCEVIDACRMESGPANLRLLNDEQLARLFRDLAGRLPKPAAIAIGMAGARTERDHERVRRTAAKVWPGIPCHATNDLETALAAAPGLSGHPKFSPLWKQRPGSTHRVMDGRDADRIAMIPRVLVLSGTGSCSFGRTAEGRTAKVGGWGHILGDKGSGFEIGLRALKAVVYYLDRDREWSLLGRNILRKLQLNEPDELIGWAQKASKTDIAALTVEVFRAWAKRA